MNRVALATFHANPIPAVDYFYTAMYRHSRSDTWPIFAPALTTCSDYLLPRGIDVAEEKSSDSLLAFGSGCQFVVMQLDRERADLLPRCAILGSIVVGLKHPPDGEDARSGLFVLCSCARVVRRSSVN